MQSGIVYRLMRTLALVLNTPLFTACALSLLVIAEPSAQPAPPPAAPATSAPQPLSAAVETTPPVLPPRPALPTTIGSFPPNQPLFMVVDPSTGVPSSETSEVRFDLEFPGGTPEDLVRAIEAAGVGTLNAIIPQELADTEIPAMRVKGVTVPQLFEALTEASRKTVTYAAYSQSPAVFAGGVPLNVKETRFGFRTQGKPSASSIWYFFADRAPTIPLPSPPPVPKVVRFYQLAPYLDHERYQVDDITTAIQTGWKMLGEEDPPTLNFHTDTKLLIAHGSEAQLRLIEEVLSQLNPREAIAMPVPVRSLPSPSPPVSRPVRQTSSPEAALPALPAQPKP